jgi:hypothetical protein
VYAYAGLGRIGDEHEVNGERFAEPEQCIMHRNGPQTHEGKKKKQSLPRVAVRQVDLRLGEANFALYHSRVKGEAKHLRANE